MALVMQDNLTRKTVKASKITTGRLFLFLSFPPPSQPEPPSLYICAPWLDLVPGNRPHYIHHHHFSGYVCDLWSALVKWPLRIYHQPNCFSITAPSDQARSQRPSNPYLRCRRDHQQRSRFRGEQILTWRVTDPCDTTKVIQSHRHRTWG